MAVASTSSSQCAWCPWDCPSPETAACRQEPRSIPPVLAGVCEPAWQQTRKERQRARGTTNVIRDLADYEEKDGPDNNAP